MTLTGTSSSNHIAFCLVLNSGNSRNWKDWETLANTVHWHWGLLLSKFRTPSTIADNLRQSFTCPKIPKNGQIFTQKPRGSTQLKSVEVIQTFFEIEAITNISFGFFLKTWWFVRVCVLFIFNRVETRLKEDLTFFFEMKMFTLTGYFSGQTFQKSPKMSHFVQKRIDL